VAGGKLLPNELGKRRTFASAASYRSNRTALSSRRMLREHMATRRFGNAVLTALFAAWLVAVTWYVWPRSEAALRRGALIASPHHEVIRAAALVLLGLLCVTLLWLILGVWRERPRTRWDRVGLSSFQLALVFGPAAVALPMLWLSYYSWCRPWRHISQLRAVVWEHVPRPVLGEHRYICTLRGGRPRPILPPINHHRMGGGR